MEKIILLLAMVSLTFASECGVLERLKVKQQWAEAFGNGQERIDFARNVFADVFIKAPEVIAMFKRVNGENIYSAEFEAHAMRVLGGLDITISMLDDQSVLQAELDHLNMQHVERKIPSEAFDIMGNVVMTSVADRITGRFDKAAWVVCGRIILDGISVVKAVADEPAGTAEAQAA